MRMCTRHRVLRVVLRMSEGEPKGYTYNKILYFLSFLPYLLRTPRAIHCIRLYWSPKPIVVPLWELMGEAGLMWRRPSPLRASRACVTTQNIRSSYHSTRHERLIARA
jgi:hypothetical protein